jgi:hypothetical protein
VKLSQHRVNHIAATLVARLKEQAYVTVTGTDQALVARLDGVITDELMVEDRLNAEIRALMKTYEADIERGHVDYQKMFSMIKNKLVKDRGVIL